jgi:hypothetical protein
MPRPAVGGGGPRTDPVSPFAVRPEPPTSVAPAAHDIGAEDRAVNDRDYGSA